MCNQRGANEKKSSTITLTNHPSQKRKINALNEMASTHYICFVEIGEKDKRQIEIVGSISICISLDPTTYCTS